MSFIGDFHNETKRQNNRGRCLHYSNGLRCNEIISAHSIQNKGQLNLIAEDGHVYRLNSDISNLKKTNGKPRPMRVGVKKASTFVGFCKYHDNELFEPIDNFPLAPNKLQVALYAYRCLCREYFVKENAAAIMEKMKGHPGLSYQQRSFMTAVSIGQNIGFSGIKHHKTHYDKALLSGEYEQFEFTCFKSSSTCNIQFSGLLYPDFDFEGRCLQDLSEQSNPLDLITFFTAPVKDGWAFVFAWHVTSNAACIPFIRSLASRCADGERLEDAILRFSLSCCENHAIRISWWDNLSESSRRGAVERMHLMAHPQMSVPPNYLVAGCEGIADWQFEYVQTTL